MSYDFRISGGEWGIGQDGDLSKVIDTEKLTQEILKIAVTPLNSNPSYPWYGSAVSKSLVGNAFDTEFIATMASGQLKNSIETLMTMQQKQNSRQFLTAAEQIAAIKNISIQRNPANPLFFTVLIQVLSKALTIVSPTFQISPLL